MPVPHPLVNRAPHSAPIKQTVMPINSHVVLVPSRAIFPGHAEHAPPPSIVPMYTTASDIGILRLPLQFTIKSPESCNLPRMMLMMMMWMWMWMMTVVVVVVTTRCSSLPYTHPRPLLSSWRVVQCAKLNSSRISNPRQTVNSRPPNPGVLPCMHESSLF